MKEAVEEIFAPVVVITCNRYEGFRACIESLQKNTLAPKTELFIGLDYPPSFEYEEGYYRNLEYLGKGIEGFKKVHLLKREYNFGVTKNWNDLVDRALEICDCYIGTEDDNVFSIDFLDYMNYYLKLFKNDRRVFSICGHAIPEEEDYFKNKEQYTFARHGYNGYGIGMWKKKMQEYTDTISKEWIEKQIRINSYKNLLHIQKRIRYKLINRIIKDDWETADSLLTVYMWLADKYQICPCKTKVKNNGWDGKGIHSGYCPEKNEGTFTDDKDDFNIENADSLLKIVGQDYYSSIGEIKFNFSHEIIWYTIHLLGFEKAKKILALLKLI